MQGDDDTGAGRTPLRRREVPKQVGRALLSCPGFSGEVAYEISWPGNLKRRSVVRGHLTTAAADARICFRAGVARLTLEDGMELRIRFLAHTEGEDVVYFERES